MESLKKCLNYLEKNAKDERRELQKGFLSKGKVSKNLCTFLIFDVCCGYVFYKFIKWGSLLPVPMSIRACVDKILRHFFYFFRAYKFWGSKKMLRKGCFSLLSNIILSTLHISGINLRYIQHLWLTITISLQYNLWLPKGRKRIM